MKFEIPTENIREAVLLAANIAGGVKPILETVKLQGDTVSATNLEQHLTLTVPGLDAGDGVCLPARKMAEILKGVTAAMTTITVKGDRAIIEADGRFVLHGMGVGDFPHNPASDGERYTATTTDFVTGLNRVAFAMARESTRYAINGVLVEMGMDQLRFVATDGRRLALSGRIGKTDLRPVLIPAAAVVAFRRILAGDDEIALIPDAGWLHVEAPNLRFSTNLLEGTFPPYRDVIPNQCEHKLSLPRQAAIAALKRAALMTSVESVGVRWSFGGGDGVELTSRSPELGESVQRLAVEADAQTPDIGLNPHFVIQALDVAPGDEVEMRIQAANKPVVFTSGDWLAVVMPVALA